MDRIKSILKHDYDLNAIHIIPQQGGWSALAYKVIDSGQAYFLKVYEKSRASTMKWTALIDVYVPITEWLLKNSGLKGKIPAPVLTTSGDVKCEDDKGIYILYEYIDGETIGANELTEKRVVELSEIIAELHSFGGDIPAGTDAIKEDFYVPFLSQLKNILNIKHNLIQDDLAKLINPYFTEINKLADSLERRSASLKNCQVRMALCHTDLHNWNVMQTEQSRLMLIDWEGLKLAPVEADMMFIVGKPYEQLFLSNYRKIHPHIEINTDILQFYQYRRKLEDIWEFIEQLLYDEQDEQQRMNTKNEIMKELRQISE